MSVSCVVWLKGACDHHVTDLSHVFAIMATLSTAPGPLLDVLGSWAWSLIAFEEPLVLQKNKVPLVIDVDCFWRQVGSSLTEFEAPL